MNNTQYKPDVVDILTEISLMVVEYEETYLTLANTIIMSRNYVDIIKAEYHSYDIEISDEELTYNCMPIIIDECSTNKICVGRMLNS